MNYYTHYKHLHDGIKPINGRAEEVRPIGKRRRDHERIEMDGDVVACRLYNTHCVRYYPDGRIGLRTGSWSTPLTAEFIHTHSPWQCFKRYNKLWVMVPSETEKYMYYPVPETGELQFRFEGGTWRPVGDVVIEKRVVNRERAKSARDPYRPFLAWAKMFLTMSDGWIMHETRKQAIDLESRGFHYTHVEKELLEMMQDDESYLKALCHLLCSHRDAKASRIVESVERKMCGHNYSYSDNYYDMQFDYKLLQGRVYRMIEKHADIYDTVQVGVSSELQTNLI